VLCTPAAAAQKVTPDVSGVVFDVGDSEGLARRVRQLIEQPDVRGAMAARALDEARNRFSSTQMARSIEETYLHALEP
jgi:glycosyltransferase involved in cell wall biosynthesis